MKTAILHERADHILISTDVASYSRFVEISRYDVILALFVFFLYSLISEVMATGNMTLHCSHYDLTG